MNVLYHHRTRGEDAQGIHVAEIIHAMRKLGHKVQVVSLASEKTIEKDANRSERKMIKASSLSYELLTFVYNIYGFIFLMFSIFRCKPDVIYERYSLNTICGVLISRVFRIPIVLEVNSPLAYEHKKHEKLVFSSVSRMLEKWACSNTKTTLVVSNELKKILVDSGIPGNKMFVVPNGINPETFHPDISGDEIRRKYKILDKTILGFVGWFKKWHGLDMLLELYAEEKWQEKNLHLLLVGDGPAMNELMNLAKDLGIGSGVTFTGPVNRTEIPLYISSFDIALQPRVNEYASPMKIFEYMAMGKCVIAPEQPNIGEILLDGVTALLFRPSDKDSMRAAISKALCSSELRNQLGGNARNTIFDRGYLWEKNAERALTYALEKNE